MKKKKREKYNEINYNNKKLEQLFNKINHTNSTNISKRIYNIIKKKIVKKKIIHSKQKTLIPSNIFKKSRLDNEKINMFSSLDKNTNKKDSDINKKYTNKNVIKLKKNQFNNIQNELNNQNNIYITGKKLLNLKRDEKIKNGKKHNNQLLLANYIGYSRNYGGENSSFQIKNTFNHINNITKNNILKNYYKTIDDMNNTDDYKMNKNKLLNSSRLKKKSKKINNKFNMIYNHKNKTNSNVSESKKQKIIRPYTQIKQSNNKIKNKINMNNNIKVNKRLNNDS